MFTGIIQKKILAKKVKKTKTDLTISTKLKDFDKHDVKIGDSIAFDGVCLTIAKIDDENMYMELMNETLIRSSFSEFEDEKFLNVEMSLTLNQKLDGHLVYGEIDTTGKIVNIESIGDSIIYTFSYPKKYAMYLINKGRITIDGVSLSVFNSDSNGIFSVSLIPHTLKVITMKEKKINDKVNLEFDVYAKIVYKQRNF